MGHPSRAGREPCGTHTGPREGRNQPRRPLSGKATTSARSELFRIGPTAVIGTHSRNGCYGILDRGQPRQSALIPAARITLPHFSVSAAMNSPKSAGEPTSGVPPRSASRSLILGSARPALISLLSLSTISTGVFLGAPRPDQLLAS